MPLELPVDMIGEMFAHAFEDLPNECCGVILGKGSRGIAVRRARNSEASPYRYNIHQEDLLALHREAEQNRWDFVAIYHSHVASPAYPSPTDVRLSEWPSEPPLELYPGAHYILISLKDKTAPVLRGYTIKDRKIVKRRIRLLPSDLRGQAPAT